MADQEKNIPSEIQPILDILYSLTNNHLLDETEKNDSNTTESLIHLSPIINKNGDDKTPRKPGTPQSASPRGPAQGSIGTPSLRLEISKLQELMLQQEQAHQDKADEVETLRRRLKELETEKPPDLSVLNEKLQSRDALINKIKKENAELLASNKQLVKVMGEYEKTISQLVSKKEELTSKYDKEKEEIAKERDTAFEHLRNMELCFNDIHQKYEKAKSVIQTLHANEKELKRSYEEATAVVEERKDAFEKLKHHASAKLKEANEEIESLQKRFSAEIAKMKAVSKKNELQSKSLEEALEQKKKEIAELTKICDELIANYNTNK